MSDEVFPLRAAQVAATMAEICRLQGATDLTRVLVNAQANILATSADDDIVHYALYLDVALPVYVSVEDNLTSIQARIQQRLRKSIKNTGNNVLDEVVIGPALVDVPFEPSGPDVQPDVGHIWQAGMVRLFLSHVAAHKVGVSNLKTQLGYVGISAFVAHKDIEPSREWQGEILAALATMDALAALLTDDFHNSSWTDQEVGAGVLRGVPLIPVNLGLDPYGFLAKHQALAGSLSPSKDLAVSLATCLARNPTTGASTKEALVRAIESASSFSAAIAASLVMEEVRTFTEDQMARIEAAMKNNSQVGGAGAAAPRIRRVLENARSVAG